MDFSLFQKLSKNELDSYLNDIDFVLEFHIKWMSDLNHALICHAELDLQQAEKNLRNDDHFTRWYNNVRNEELLEMSAFKNLGSIYDEMLSTGLVLLSNVKKNNNVCSADYTSLLSLTSELRVQIGVLKQKIKSDLKLVAKIMAKVFEYAEDGVMITDVDSNILSVNRAFVKVTKYTEEEVLGKKPSILHSGTHDKRFYERMWEVLLRENRWQGEVWNRRKNNEIYPEWLTITSVQDENDVTTHYIGIFSDISTENEGDERLYHLAHYDSLCDLPNRMLFFDRLRQSLSRSKRNQKLVAVMFLDLDGFKAVNDRFGHSAGDILLQQVSVRISSILRESDTLARIGGDEFTLIINDINNIESISNIAIKILSVIQEPFSYENTEFTMSASIGISLFPSNSENINMLVRHADIAMYKAKDEGKNCFKFYDAAMG